MLRRITKLGLFLVLALSIFLVLHKTVGLQKDVQLANQLDIGASKDKFLTAISEQNLSEAKENFALLQAHLPADDTFIETVAPAYMADLYIQYAQKMAFNENAYQSLLEQARVLAPEHPYLQETPELDTIAKVDKDKIPDAYDEKLEELDSGIATIENQIAVEEKLIEKELKLAEAELEQEIKKLQRVARKNQLSAKLEEIIPKIEVQAMPAEPKPAASTVAQAVTTVTQSEPEDVIARLAQLDTNDICTLSYYTRSGPLGSCVDSIAEDYYGPAMFVIANDNEQPLFAFTQAPVSSHEYDLFCHLSGQCYIEEDPIDNMVSQLQLSGIDLDLKDVKQTVVDYNRYCQMTKLCEPIKTSEQNAQRSLTKGELQRYALWLTKQTGARYRLLNEADSAAIYRHFQLCMQTGECPAGMLEQLALVFQQKNLLLVRELN
jgi:hypothetical protein